MPALEFIFPKLTSGKILYLAGEFSLPGLIASTILVVPREINRNSGQTFIMAAHSAEAAKSGGRVITVQDDVIF